MPDRSTSGPFAAFDLGSNSLEVLIAAVGEGGALDVLHDRAPITRIGQGVEATGRLDGEAMARTLRAITEATDRALALGTTTMSGMATAGLRGASNADEFVDQVESATGLRFEVIDGNREAALAFATPAARYAAGRCGVVDVGGRSTELIVGESPHVETVRSVPLGGVRLTERFVRADPPSAETLEAIRQHVAATLQAHAPALPDQAPLIGVSGTVVALRGLALGLSDARAAVSAAEGTMLTRAQVAAALQTMAPLGQRARLRGSLIPAGRADVIIASTVLVGAIMDHYRRAAIPVSNLGVRYGLLQEMVSAIGVESPTTDR